MTERTMEGAHTPERSKIRSLQYYDGTGWPQLIQSSGANMWTSPVWQPTRSDAATIDEILKSRQERASGLLAAAAKLAEVEASNAELAKALKRLVDLQAPHFTGDEFDERCVDCGCTRYHGHESWCSLGQALEALANHTTSDKGAGG